MPAEAKPQTKTVRESSLILRKRGSAVSKDGQQIQSRVAILRDGPCGPPQDEV